MRCWALRWPMTGSTADLRRNLPLFWALLLVFDRDQDCELIVGRRIVAAVSQGSARCVADQCLHVRDDGCQGCDRYRDLPGSAFTWVANWSALGMAERGCDCGCPTNPATLAHGGLDLRAGSAHASFARRIIRWLKLDPRLGNGVTPLQLKS